MTLRIRMLLIVLVAWSLACRQATHGPTAMVDHHAMSIEVQPDGSIVVSETFEGALFRGGTPFVRDLSSANADEFEWLSAAADGAAWTRGEGRPDTAPEAGMGLSIDDGHELRAVWTPRSADDDDHTLSLRYRARHAVGTGPGRARLSWPVLPAIRQFTVGESRVDLQLPGGVPLLNGTGMAEAGWTVAVADGGFQATRAAVGQDPATLVAEFPLDPTVIQVPAWQVAADRRSEFAPAFVSGGLFVLVIGVGVLWIIRFQYPQVRVPSGKPPGAPAEFDGSAVIPRLSEAEVHAIRAGRATRDAALMRGLSERGLVEPERVVVARGLITTGWIGLVVAGACAAVAWWTLTSFGWWAQILPVTIALVALVFAGYGWRFRVLTGTGERLRRAMRRQTLFQA